MLMEAYLHKLFVVVEIFRVKWKPCFNLDTEHVLPEALLTSGWYSPRWCSKDLVYKVEERNLEHLRK
jgi:hypothetical protein